MNAVGAPGGIALVRHPASVSMIVVEGDRIVLVRQTRAGAPRPTLELPAGCVQDDERAEEAAARELAEECGLQAGAWRWVGAFWAAPAYSTEWVEVLQALDVGGDGVSAPQPDEDIVVERRPLTAMPRELSDATSIAAFALWARGESA